MSRVPKVSVLMPAYNAADSISQSIESVLLQSFKDFELLVLDDGSQDQTQAIIKAFTDNRIRLLVHEKNEGLVVSRNKLLAEGNGKYLAWLDSDDWADPERLVKQVHYLDSHSEVGICGSHSKLVGEQQGYKYVPTDSQYIHARMFFKGTIDQSTVMMRSSVIHEHKLSYQDGKDFLEDHTFFYQAGFVTKLANLDEPLVTVRIKETPTDRKQRFQKRNEHFLSFLKQNLLDSSFTDQEIRLLHIALRERDKWNVDDNDRLISILIRLAALNQDKGLHEPMAFNAALMWVTAGMIKSGRGKMNQAFYKFMRKHTTPTWKIFLSQEIWPRARYRIKHLNQVGS